MAHGDFNPQRGGVYQRSPLIEAAKWMQASVKRFLAERDTAQEVDEAVEEWLKQRKQAGER